MNALVPVTEVLAELERQIAATGSIRAFAQRAGVTHPAVVLIRNGDRPMTERIANACGYEAVTAFRRVSKGVA